MLTHEHPVGCALGGELSLDALDHRLAVGVASGTAALCGALVVARLSGGAIVGSVGGVLALVPRPCRA